LGNKNLRRPVLLSNPKEKVSAMSFTCELSGEPLQSISHGTSIVVTPSGHICQRRLLLPKLAANGGTDPWDASRPLHEDELIELQTSRTVPKIMAPRSNDKSVQVTLLHLQQDYDAVLLELFDTRQLLAATREELSQALYQNDAAVRVVARMAAERDQARSAFNEWDKTTTNGPTIGATITSSSSSAKRAVATGEEEEADPAAAGPAKKVKVINLSSVLPSEDQTLMLATWDRLSAARKATHKAAAKAAPTPAQLTRHVPPAAAVLDGVVVPQEKSGIIASLLAAHGPESYVQVIADQVYQLTKEEDGSGNNGWTSKILCTLTNPSPPTAVSTGEGEEEVAILVGFADGSVSVMGSGATDQAVVSLPTVDGQAIVSVALHPDHLHVIAATAGGHIAIGGWRNDDNNAWVAAFGGKNGCSYTAGALHPDGLIYLAGRNDGSIDLWDFKNQTNAANLPNDGGGAVRAVSISSNGYHVAAVYDNQEVLVWDLRKQSVLATLNTGTEALDQVRSLTFDAAGKYLAYAGVGKSGGKPQQVQVTVVTVKQWNTTYSLHGDGSTSGGVANGMAWNKAGIAVATTFENNGAANLIFPL
jgi:pre-mRNA-processing factor 19